jgi:hypothetical protein
MQLEGSPQPNTNPGHLGVACAVALTHKESILFMQRLAAIERNGITDGPIKAQYEEVFLNMLYTMCSTPRPDAPEVQSSRQDCPQL